MLKGYRNQEDGLWDIPLHTDKINAHASVVISLGNLCDEDCEIILTKDHIYALKADSVLLQGQCNTANGLWTVPMQPNHVQLKPTCAGLYHSSTPSKSSSVPSSSFKTKSSKKTSYNHDFSSLNGVIDDSLFDKAIGLFYKDQQANIIIRKKKN